jgi:hypothetical protein
VVSAPLSFRVVSCRFVSFSGTQDGSDAAQTRAVSGSLSFHVVSCRFESFLGGRSRRAQRSSLHAVDEIHGLFLARSDPCTRQRGEMTCWCDSGRAIARSPLVSLQRRLRATPSWLSASVSISAGDYCGPRLRIDRDVHHDSSVYLLARLRGHRRDGLIVGRAGFQSPEGDAFDFSLPPGVRDNPVSQCHEVGRLVSERSEASSRARS